MSGMAIKAFVIDPDLKEAVVELWMDDQPLGHITLAAPALERLIQRLAECRASLADAVPTTYEHLSTASGIIIDPSWSVLAGAGERQKILAFRHPGMGWLPFVLPEHQQIALSKVLAAQPPSQTAH